MYFFRQSKCNYLFYSPVDYSCGTGCLWNCECMDIVAGVYYIRDHRDSNNNEGIRVSQIDLAETNIRLLIQGADIKGIVKNI